MSEFHRDAEDGHKTDTAADLLARAYRRSGAIVGPLRRHKRQT
ncbi:MAG: hypothetical protein OYH76_06505 [Defluviicoccus sp.]|nr:hypothetical protein [Defluviicoccus sp.]MDE0275528.1 hypothetical protein [Defluviicoccus sp.]